MEVDTASIIINVLVILGFLDVAIRIIRLMIPPLIRELRDLWLELKAISKINKTEAK